MLGRDAEHQPECNLSSPIFVDDVEPVFDEFDLSITFREVDRSSGNGYDSGTRSLELLDCRLTRSRDSVESHETNNHTSRLSRPSVHQ